MKSLFLCSSWLLMMSSIAHASTWDKDINQFATSLTLDHHSNIYNNTDKEVGSSVYQFAIVNNSVSLFEGYGIALPFSMRRSSYSKDSDLDNTSFEFKPSVQFFMSPSSTLKFRSEVSKNQIFGGNIGAEFADKLLSPLNNKRRFVGMSLDVGQAPANEFLTVHVNYSDSELRNSQSSSRHSTKQIGSQYGFRISEDSYFQLSGNYQWQQSNGRLTRLAEAGIGAITGLGGSNELNLIAGGYQRIENGQKGLFWTLSNSWTASEQLSFKLKTSQRSTLNNSASGASQLTTIYQLDSIFTFSDSHQLSLKLHHQKNNIKEIRDKALNKSIIAVWQWEVASGVVFRATASHAENSRFNIQDSVNRTQQKLGISVGYQW